MKKNYLLVSMVCAFTLSVNMQAQTFNEGNIAFSAGYGFPNFLGSIFAAYEDQQAYTAKSVGPIFFKFEYGASENVGIGIDVAYSSTDVSYGTQGVDGAGNTIYYDNVFSFNSVSVLGRVNWHFGDSDVFDPYFGVGVGYRDANYTFTSDDPDAGDQTLNGINHFGFDCTVGARYFFVDNFGLYVELGIAKAPVQFGLTAKF